MWFFPQRAYSLLCLNIKPLNSTAPREVIYKDDNMNDNISQVLQLSSLRWDMVLRMTNNYVMLRIKSYHFCGTQLLFSCSVVSDSLLPHGLQHARLLCPSPSPGACSHSCHWVNDDIQPSHHLSSPSSPALDLSIHQCLFCCLVHRVIVIIFLNIIDKQTSYLRWCINTCFRGIQTNSLINS